MSAARVVAGVVAGLVVGGLVAVTLDSNQRAAQETPLATVTAPPSPEAVNSITADAASSLESEFPSALYSIDAPDSPWVVVNKQRPLNPQDYVPVDLVDVAGVPGGATGQLRTEAAQAMTDLHTAAEQGGVPFRISTAYRSKGFQESLYADAVARIGRSNAELLVARGGYSEHQTGWAADVYTTFACRTEACFADDPAGKWLADNAHTFGFVVRYPEGGTDITGYVYEPWHLRYVGTLLAEELIRTQTDTLEEFFGLPAAPDYD
jgi:D-alanyl-D-alanine carboxypeptidase